MTRERAAWRSADAELLDALPSEQPRALVAWDRALRALAASGDADAQLVADIDGLATEEQTEALERLRAR